MGPLQKAPPDALAELNAPPMTASVTPRLPWDWEEVVVCAVLFWTILSVSRLPLMMHSPSQGVLMAGIVGPLPQHMIPPARSMAKPPGLDHSKSKVVVEPKSPKEAFAKLQTRALACAVEVNIVITKTSTAPLLILTLAESRLEPLPDELPGM